MLRALFLCLLLVACGRPLTEAERDFAATVHGPALDVSRVRLHGLNPLYAFRMTRDPRPQRACRERIRPPETGPVTTRVAATVLFDDIFYAKPVFRRDFLAGYPETLDLAQAMLLAHELTHVWQWQNRETTGYSPFAVVQEHAPGSDPYLFDLTGEMRFADFTYEQQGSLVEEFVCCRALDPEGGRTARLHALLTPVFPGIAQRPVVRESHVRLLYADVNRDGICA